MMYRVCIKRGRELGRGFKFFPSQLQHKKSRPRICIYIQLGVYFKFKEYFKKAILEKKIDTLFTKKPQKYGSTF